MREPVTAYIGLGANLGDRVRALRSAIDGLGELPGTRVVRVSSFYETAPHEASGPDFVNAVAQIETTCDAYRLLGQLQAIEARAGRERPYVNAPRTLDLDLLLYGDARIESPRLTLPHPRLHERAFVLTPLAEIAPALVDPQWLGRAAHQPLRRLQTV